MKLAVLGMNGNTALGMENATVTMKNWNSAQPRVQSMTRSSTTRKKSLNYNSREISSQLIRATKARSAGTVLTKAKSKLAMLQRCKGSGQYNDSEVEIAITHAKRMVKCAQLKFVNLKKEEVLKKSYEKETEHNKQHKKNEIKRRTAQKENEIRQKMAAQELQQTLKEKQMRRELAQKRRMHRNQEQSKIAEAEMKYLQDQLNRNDGSSSSNAGVSLDISMAAMNMSELQLSEHAMQLLENQIEMEVEAEMSIETGSGAVMMSEAVVASASASSSAGTGSAAAGAALDVSI